LTVKLRPSNPRWVPCPGSPQAEAKFPDSRPFDERGEGIAAHWVAARILGSWFPQNDLTPIEPRSLIGTPTDAGVEITEEMVDCVAFLLADVRPFFAANPGGLFTERATTLDPYVSNVPGRLDVGWMNLSKTYYRQWDYKHGFQWVDHEGNLQNLIYALFFHARFPSIERYDLCIVQPRGAGASQPVRSWTVGRPEMDRFAEIVTASATEARGPRPRLIAGEHCLNCRAAPACPSATRLRWEIRSYLEDLDVVDIDDTRIGWELDAILRAEAIVKAQRKALERMAEARMMKGGVIPGFGREPKLGNRQWTLSEDEVLSLGAMNGADLEVRTVVTPAQAEARGVDERTVNLFTHRPPKGSAVARVDPKKARDAFNG